MANELGLFLKYGLRVELRRELGWATIRDKVVYRELDAAHAVAGMPFAATLGLGSVPCDCLTALVLNQHGNAITLSDELWKRGVRNGATLRQEILRLGTGKTLTFGIVYPFSSHNFLLRAWLTDAGINPDRDVRIVVVPPPQMVSNLKAGHLDGFCVGEPWNSVAVQSAAGWCVAASAELAPGHPEKVLMTRRDFAEKHPSEHLALVAAVLEACAFCQAPANYSQIIDVLARPEYVGVPKKALEPGLRGELDFGRGNTRRVAEFNVFYAPDANEPSAEKAAWVFRHLRETGRIRNVATLNPSLGRRIFRADLFQQALRLTHLNDTASQSNHDQPKTNLIFA
jgi:ABC-type nitrate/sulfonate/bicarbonate transport system substrate-binding protein